MDTNQQPKAAYLAQELKAGKWSPNILQNEVALRQCAAEELLRLYAENETLRKRECLHQIAEPAPVVAQTEALVRYCPGCGSVGTVEGKYRDCCPDGNEARMIPQALAKKCHDTFNIAIDSLLAQPQEAAPVAQAVPAEARQLHGDVRLAHDQCRAVVSLANSVAEVYAARAAIVEHDNSLANQIGQASAAAMEWLGDELNASDAATEEDEWLDPIFDAAQERWPQYAQAALAAVAVPTKVIEALEMLENGALNVAINAKNRGDGYDEGYANAMAKMARETLDLLAAAPAADAPTTAAALSRACDLLSSTIGILMGQRAKIAYTDNSPVAALVNEAVDFLRPWPEQLPSSAASPVVLPEHWAVCVGGRIWIGKTPEHVLKLAEQEGMEPTLLYTEQQVRALLATGGQAQIAPQLDEAWKARMLDGQTLVRDKDGIGFHPTLPDFDEGVKCADFFAALGIELKCGMAESEMDSDAYEAMTENGLTDDGDNYNAWTPQRPEGEGWSLVAVFDTEDGPACWWMRDKPFVPQRQEGYRERIDNAAVEVLAISMKAKLAGQRAKGYSGWNNDCTQQRLSELLRQCVEKGDPVDVANFCAFLLARGESIAPQAQADAPVVLPAPDVFAKVSHKGAAKWDVEFTWPVGKFEEDGDHKLYTEQQVRAMLATATGLPAQPARTWSCPVRTVADLANNLLTMDQTLPIYGAQYIEHPAGRRRAIAVPPTVSIERVKDSRWIGEGDELNAAIIWTQAEQPAAPQAQADARDALEEAASVLSSINKVASHEVQVGDEVCYWQRKEWIEWAEKEVLPKVRAAIAAAQKDE